MGVGRGVELLTQLLLAESNTAKIPMLPWEGVGLLTSLLLLSPKLLKFQFPNFGEVKGVLSVDLTFVTEAKPD